MAGLYLNTSKWNINFIPIFAESTREPEAVCKFHDNAAERIAADRNELASHLAAWMLV